MEERERERFESLSFEHDIQLIHKTEEFELKRVF